MKKSTFKRVAKENTNPVVNFLNEANYKYAGTGILDAWINGDSEKSNDLVVVVINNTDEDAINDVLYRTPEGIKVESYNTMYQTFLAHKAARFSK
jgi:hypothetical protein